MTGEIYLLQTFSGNSNQVTAYDILDLSQSKSGLVYKYESSKFTDIANGNLQLRLLNNTYNIINDRDMAEAYTKKLNNLDKFADGGNGFLKWSIGVLKRFRSELMGASINPYYIHVSGYEGRVKATIGYGFTYAVNNGLGSGSLLANIISISGVKHIELGITDHLGWNKVMDMECGVFKSFALQKQLKTAAQDLNNNYNIITKIYR